MPNWLFWIIVWWAVCFATLLLWFAKNRNEKISFFVLFFIVLTCWTYPFITLFYSIKKLFRKDN